MKFLIGAVPYLNGAPLVFDLEQRPSRMYELVKATPSELSRRMTDGELHAALMPIIDYCAGTGACILPDISISSFGEVASVLLFSRVPLENIETVGLDVASRSSAALLRVLFAERWGLDPVYVPYTEDVRGAIGRFDAILVIGDRALAYRKTIDCDIHDLGHCWYEMTSLPFVFAAWILQSKDDGLQPLARRLHEAKEQGLMHLKDVIEARIGTAGLNREAITLYFRDNINHDFSQAHMEGVLTFQRLCHKHNLLSGIPREIELYPMEEEQCRKFELL